MRALNYNHLQYFWAVAREGHLTRAAQRLNISQSALSTQIRKLEDQLGHALFERRGRGLILTEAGQRTLDYADAIFSAGEELLATLSASQDRVQKSLSIGALATLSRNFQLAFLEPVLGDPSVSLTLRSGSMAELMADLEAHRLDVVLVNQEPPRTAESSWILNRLAEQRISLIGTPQRVAKGRDLESLLSTHPLILPSRHSGVRSGFDALAARLSVTPNIIAEVDDMAMMRVLTRQDIGLAVIPPIVVRDELANARLVEAVALPGLTETFSAITLQRRFPNELVSLLLKAAIRAPA
jgi:LysR family transcriptional activator of nhaA